MGQTYEGLSDRIGRHLTGRRSDAVAMYVLDPAEVAEVEVWPFFGLPGKASSKAILDAAESTVYRQVRDRSRLRTVLNQKSIPDRPTIDLPASVRRTIVPPEIYERLRHADIRIARRAATVANLARVISERVVKPELRNTLWLQTRRLEMLARERLNEIGGAFPRENESEEP